MKKIFLLTIGLCWLTAACELETSDNGDLDGFWQLSAVDTLSTGHATDTRASGTYWAFQGPLLQMRDTVAAHPDLIFNFLHTGDSLLLQSPYFLIRDSGDVRIKELGDLSTFGITRTEERFKVVELNGDNMQLQSTQLRLHFRKY